MLNCRVDLIVVDHRKMKERITPGEQFVLCLAAYQSRFELAVAIDVATRNHKNLMRTISMVHLARLGGIRCRQVSALSKCIGNNHSAIMARRNGAESARTARIWSQIVRRMVVVLCADKPVKWSSFATQAGPEREFAGSLADRAGFEPAVAVTPRTLSKRVP